MWLSRVPNTPRAAAAGVEVGRKSRQVYYSRREDTQSVIYATHIDTKATRQIARLPFRGTFGSVNADETLLVGAYSDRAPAGRGRPALDANVRRRYEDRRRPDFPPEHQLAEPCAMFTNRSGVDALLP
jgi:hypothetical protein